MVRGRADADEQAATEAASRHAMLTPNRPQPNAIWIALLVAVVMNAANLFEPVAVDDVCHQYYAAQVARDPLHPFEFEASWHQRPVPAWTIMVAPVHSYYWAPCIAWFGESVVAWHAWMLPLQWLFCWSLLVLLHRWLRRGAVPAMVTIALGPAVLPGLNLMLDVPMLAIGLAGLVALQRGFDRSSAAAAVLAGVLWGLAFQTKYSAMAFFGPWLILWVLRGRWREWCCACVAAAATALGIEALLAWSHGGGSYFLQQLSYTQQRVPGHLLKGMIQHVGVLAIPGALLALHGLTGRLRWPLVAALGYALGLAVVGLYPDGARHTLVDLAPDSVAYVLMSALTWAIFGTVYASFLRGGSRAFRLGRMHGSQAMRVFLVGWAIAEVLSSFVVSPFPAARRVIMVVVAFTVAGAWLSARRPRRRGHGRGRSVWPLAVTAATLLGFGIQALDYVEANAWVRAADEVARYSKRRDPDAAVYFCGGWGFEFYAPRAGVPPLLEGRVQLQPGDLVAIGSIDGIDEAWFEPDARLEQVDELLFGEDAIPYSTQFCYYSGQRPIDGQVGARYRVRILRAKAALHTRDLHTIPDPYRSRGPQ